MSIIRLDEENEIQKTGENISVSVLVPQETSEIPQNLFDQHLEKTSEDKVDAVVDEMFSAAIVHTVESDEEVRDKITDTAKQVITNKTEAIKHKSEKEEAVSFFDANESACAIFGYDEKTTPKWQVRMMKFGASVWFIIYYIISLFTIAPVMVFLNGLSKVIKKHWISMILAILFYLLIVIGIPIISTLASGVLGK